MKNDNPRLKVALELAKRFTVIPVQKNKQSYFSWKEFQTRRASDEEISSWWTEYPDANVAIVLYPGHVVLDIDDQKIAQDVLSKTDIIKRTRVERTLRGLHIWFVEKQPKTKTKNFRHSLKIEAELRGHGTYLVVPPSEGYELLSDAPIMEVEDAMVSAVELLETAGVSVKDSIPSHPILEGVRNETMTRIIGSLCKKSADFQGVMEQAQKINNERCVPPLPEKEVEAIAKSIHKAELVSHSFKDVSVRERKWVSLQTLDSRSVPQIEWIWEGYLAKGYTTLLSGKPKAGKTTLLFHLLRSMQQKKEFLGHETKLQKGVLILTEENEQLYQLRGAKYGLTKKDVLVLSRYMVFGWSREQILEQVRFAIEVEGVELVVVDTLADFWGVKEENDAPTVQEAMQQLRSVVHDKGVAMLLIHHLRKVDGEQGNAHRGSGALLGSVDIGLELQYSNNVDGRRELKSNSRFHETPKSLLMELRDEEYKRLGDASTVEKADVKRRLFEELSDSEHEELEVIRERMNPKPSNGQVREILITCRDEGSVDFIGTGKRGSPYKYKKRSAN